MSVMSRMRDLDRKAGLYSQPSQEQWRRAAARWRWLLAVAVAQVVAVVVAGFLNPTVSAGMSAVAVTAVALAFQAGRLKAEHDRLHGRDDVIGGMRRPPGL